MTSPSLFVFDGRQLYDVNNRDTSWPAMSGPWGKGSMPLGGYEFGKPVVIDANDGNKPYTDQFGFAWFAELTPMFEMVRPRSGFGAHPDGNVEGSEGCVVIRLADTQPVFEYLLDCPRPSYLIVT